MFKKEELNYSYDVFAKLSAKSFEIHYERHHSGYVNNLNELVEKNHIVIEKLEDLIKLSYLKKDTDLIFESVYNNAAQHFNHSFFWKSLTIKMTEKSDQLNDLIKKSFGSIEKMESQFYNKGLSLFGSGWIWLVFNKVTKSLELIKTYNADTPIVFEYIVPLLVCDVWEHAYYIDYLNNRAEYLKAIFIYLNWDFANKNLEKI